MQKRRIDLYGHLIVKDSLLIFKVRSHDLAFLLDLLFMTQSIMVKNTAVHYSTNGKWYVIVQGPKMQSVLLLEYQR